MSEAPASGGRRNPIPVVVVTLAVLTAAGMLFLRSHLAPYDAPPYVVAEEDGGGAGPRIVRKGEHFQLDLEPHGTLIGGVAARGFLVRGSESRPWTPQFYVERDGGVHVQGPVDEVFAGVPEGAWELVIAIGRPGSFPATAEEALRSAPAAKAPWHLVREPIVLAPAAR